MVMESVDLLKTLCGAQGSIPFTFQVIDGLLQLRHRPLGKLGSGLSLGVKVRRRNDENQALSDTFT